jgi:CRISPR-associated protein Cmr5
MNKKNIDKLIPEAIKKLQSLQSKDGSIDKVYQGYLASFGPTVISSGIVKTVAIYIDKSDSNKKRKEVTELMFDLIDENPEKFINDDKNGTNYALKNKILEANIACKLSIRTFELKD